MNPARDYMRGFNKSWDSPEAGDLGVGLGVMLGDTRENILPLFHYQEGL